MRSWLAVVALLVLAPAIVALAAPARAAQPVDVALVLAVDVSGSISEAAWELQRDGIADAISSDGFAQSIAAGQIGRVALAVVQWGTAPRLVLGWRILETPAAARTFAQDLRQTERAEAGGTCMGTALKAIIAELIPWADHATRRVIDISGDGASNCGLDLAPLRAAALADGITINGLPIVTPVEPLIADWYGDNVIGGPGAFLIVADGYARFAEAFRRKLTIETAEATP